MKSGEVLISNLLSGNLQLNTFKNWITTFRVSAHEEGLLRKIDDEITQYDFIIFFLKFLRERASYVKNQIKKNVEDKRSRSSVGTKQVQQECLMNDQCVEAFPTLETSTMSKPGTKSMRRINPTPIRKEIEEGKKKNSHRSKQETKKDVPKMVSEVTVASVEKEKYANRFSSTLSFKSSQKKKISYVPFDGKFIEITEHKERNINIIADLYTCLLKNNLVPNLSDEIQFILNVFNRISNIDSQSLPKIKNSDDAMLLCHVIDWQYFCIEIIIRIDFIISKMDYIIRAFLHNRISKLNFRNNRRKTIFLDKLKAPLHKNQFTLVIPFQKLCEKASRMDSDCCNCKKETFFELEKKWKLNWSETDLATELEFLLTFKDNITSLNSFGMIFVESLIQSLEDSRKEESYDNKLNKLTQRMSIPPDQEDNGFFYFEFFYKLVVDFCMVQCPQHLLYIKFWLLYFIKSLSKEFFCPNVAKASAELRNHIVSGLFIKISLAKFLGYIEFSDIKKYEDLTENEKHIQTLILSEFLPPLNTSEILLWAIKKGQLTDTIPWLIQFISMSSKFVSCLPYYRDILIPLISINLSRQLPLSKDENIQLTKKFLGYEIIEDSLVKINILTPKTRSFSAPDTEKFNTGAIIIKKSTLLFINLWIGKLFNNKIFGEDIYFKLFEEYTKIVKETKNNSDTVTIERTTDSVFIIDEEIFLMLCSHFSKMTYWEQNSFTCSSKTVRNIRPLLLESDDEQTPTDNVDIQAMLEDQFIKENKHLATIIEFISSRVYEVFLNGVEQLVSENNSEEERCENLKNIIEDCQMRISQSIKALIAHDTDEAVGDVTISICSKRLKNDIHQWLILHGFEEALIKVFTNYSHCEETTSRLTEKGDQSTYSPKLSAALINLSYKMRELNRNENVQQNVTATIDDFIMLSKEMIVKNDLYNNSKEYTFLNDIHIMSWDYVLEILTNQPQLITKEFLEKVTLFWKEYFQSLNNAKRLFCPRLIKASVLKNKSEQRLIAHNIAQISFWVFKQELATIEELEHVYIGILHHTWNEDEFNFLLMTFSEINDLVKKDGPHALLTTIDIVSDSIIGIMEIENMQPILHE